MPFLSGTVDVGEEPAPVCGVPVTGVQVKNTGSVTVYFGGSDVTAEGAGQGYPVDPGTSENFTGAAAKETPVVPAPDGDMDPAVLYGRTAPGTGTSRVSFITVSMT